MFRRTALVVIAAGAGLLAPQSASATTTNNTVTSIYGLPAGAALTTSTTLCSTKGTGIATATHINGPDGSGSLGTGSLLLTAPAHTQSAFTISLPADDDADLSLLLPANYQEPIASGDTPMTATASLIITNTGAGIAYQLEDPLSSTPGWQSENLISFSNWYQIGGPIRNLLGSGPYADFAPTSSNTHPGTLTRIEYDFDNCAGSTTQSYAIDDVQYGETIGANTTNTSYDFEPPPPTVLTPSVSKTTIVAGSAVTSAVTMAVSGQDVTGQPVSLWGRTAPATAYSLIKTVPVSSTGQAAVSGLKPNATTSYEWRYVNNGMFASVVANPQTVKVARKIALFIVKSAVSKGKRLQATGTVTPKKSGLKVTLWRTKDSHRVKIKTTKLHSSGFFSFSKVLRVGHYHLFATVAGGSTNATGTSAKHAFVVVR